MATANKKILITGANGGMGRLCSSQAVTEGYSLVLVDLVSTGLDDFAATLAGAGASVNAYGLDVTDAAAVADFVEDVGRMGGIDAVIHTVGVTPTMADWQRIIDIDLVSTVRFMESLRPQLNPGCGAVVISSSSGYMAPANVSIEEALADPLDSGFFDRLNDDKETPLRNPGYAYSYAKKALRQYVARQASVWGAEGKRLVSISPGLIDTQAAQTEYSASETFDEMVRLVPLKRLGLPAEIANTALFLVSDKASYITGCDILVDGGLIAAMGKTV